MLERFENYPQPTDYIPDNRPKPRPPHKLEIMAGESTIHYFEIPFNVLERTIDVQVLYKLGLDLVLVKENKDLNIKVNECGCSEIECNISSQESLLFQNTVLYAYAQIRFVMTDRKVIFTEIYPVKLSDSLDLDKEKPTPIPGVIGGIGYTED